MMERILVVDDEKLIRWSLMKNLVDAGYEVLEAADGQQALEMLDQEGADLMLLDVRMPKRTASRCSRTWRSTIPRSRSS